jgi:two-component sensor histidine kinase
VQRDLLQLVWEERNGPRVQQPASRGFGTRSVITSIESQLGGRADFDWRAEGLVCRLSVPLGKDLPAGGVNIQPRISSNGEATVLRSVGAAE